MTVRVHVHLHPWVMPYLTLLSKLSNSTGWRPDVDLIHAFVMQYGVRASR